MVVIFILIWILQAFHVHEAMVAWAWMGHHVLLTILALIFLA